MTEIDWDNVEALRTVEETHRLAATTANMELRKVDPTYVLVVSRYGGESVEVERSGFDLHRLTLYGSPCPVSVFLSREEARRLSLALKAFAEDPTGSLTLDNVEGETG